MRKKIVKGVSAVLVLTAAVGITVYAKEAKVFYGEDGKIIQVWQSEDASSEKVVEMENDIIGEEPEVHEVGDMLYHKDGSVEKVIAVSEDGEFITEQLQ